MYQFKLVYYALVELQPSKYLLLTSIYNAIHIYPLIIVIHSLQRLQGVLLHNMLLHVSNSSYCTVIMIAQFYLVCIIPLFTLGERIGH